MRMPVLFNLKNGADPVEYEAWAIATDAPSVRGRRSHAADAGHRRAISEIRCQPVVPDHTRDHGLTPLSGQVALITGA